MSIDKMHTNGAVFACVLWAHLYRWLAEVSHSKWRDCGIRPMDNHHASTSPRAWAEVLGITANHDLRSAMFLSNAFSFYAPFIIHWLRSDFHWKHSDQDICLLSIFGLLFTRHFCRQWIRAGFDPSIVLYASRGGNINRYALCRGYFSSLYSVRAE